MMSGLEERSGSIEASNTPSQCLYLADPSRFSILGIKLIAQASIKRLPSPSKDAISYDSVLTYSSNYSSSNKSITSPSYPPTSYKSPVKGSHSVPIVPRSRPTSLDLGQRAREAFLDVSRGLNNGLRNRSKTDICDVNDQVTTSHENLKQTASQSSTSSSCLVTSSKSDSQTQQHKDEVFARRVYNLRPDSLGFEAGCSSTSLALQINSRMEVSSLNSDKSQWERRGYTRTEFVRDDDANSQIKGRAGVFNQVQKGELDSEASEDESDEEIGSDTERASVSEGHAIDSLHLLLKVSPPPVQYLQQQNLRLFGRETNHVILKAHLKLNSSSTKTLRSSRTPPAGPRTFKMKVDGHQSDKTSSIIFVSTDSSQKLYEAVDSTRLHRDGISFTGPLSSPDAARIEGIDWTAVQEEGHDKSNLVKFEWKWNPLGKDSASHKDVLGEKAVKCACAFIELKHSMTTARILASFSFLIAFPPVGLSGTADSAMTSSTFPATQMNPPQLVDWGVGLGLCDMETMAQRSTVNSAIVPTPAIKTTNGGLYSRFRRLSGGAIGLYSQSKSRRQLSNGSGEQASAISESSINVSPTKVSLQVDHVEIHLEDVEEDGPILRAALANLDRRTASLKKAAKTIVKSAEEVRANLCHLQVSESDLTQSIEAAAYLNPSTLGYLHSMLLDKKLKQVERNRQEEREMLQNYVEAPLLSLIDMCKTIQEQSKSFDLESKLYYAGTQKWLSSRSFTSTNNVSASRENFEAYSSSAVGFDRASGKQERIDDKQRLRQARFHLARLDIFRAVNDVHGGEAELQLANHVLTLCRWQCHDKESKEMMQYFEKALQLERHKIQRRGEETQQRYVEVEEQIDELSGLLGMAVLDMEVESNILPSSESETALSSKTRQAGNRFKNLLSSLGNSKQHYSTANITTSASYALQETDNSPSKWSPIHSRNKSITKIAQSAPAANDMNQSQKKSGPLPFEEHQMATPESPLHFGEISAPTHLSRSTSIGIASPKEGDLQIFPTSHSPQRSSSNSGALVSPRRRDAFMDSAKASPVKVVATATNDKMPGAQQVSNISLLQPRRAAQQSRKKEGILWAMSKPIAGAGGADAPKSVSRSQNWRECWVVLSGSGHLGQYAEWKDVKVMEPSQPLIDLRFATVREARGVERRFTFEIITRENRRFFQANNEEEMKNWINAISFAIESLFNGTSSIRQIDKVARVAGGVNAFNGGVSDEFGSPMIEASALGRHRAFSQSLTDLSTASSGGPGRLFSRGGNREEIARKRDSKGSSTFATAHLSALSEGVSHYGSPLIDYPLTPHHQTPWINHERGISNKTPVSGYVQQSEGNVLESSAVTQSNWIVEADYDRKIEEMVHSSFGGSNHAHRRSLSLLSSVSPTRQSSQTSQRDAVVVAAAMMTPSSSTTKYTRSKEIIAIAARPENSYCADCCIENPKWASWSINGEPRCIFICITCSGHHRGLGVGVSRVKSIDLDDWTEEQLNSAKEWGNDKVNALYEAKKPTEVMVANIATKGKQFCIDKYVHKMWYEDDFTIKAALDQKVGKPIISTEKVEKNINTLGLPRWPSSPPVVFVSMLEGDDENEERDSKSRSGACSNSPSTSIDGQRVSFEDQGPFRQSSPSLQSFHRLPCCSIEKRIAI